MAKDKKLQAMIDIAQQIIRSSDPGIDVITIKVGSITIEVHWTYINVYCEGLAGSGSRYEDALAELERIQETQAVLQ